MVHTQSAAKRFFAERAVQRAGDEGVPLSDAERRMLSWSESDPELTADPQGVMQLAEQLASEISDEEYEEKIAGLLDRRFAEEVTADPGAKDAWQQALSVLNPRLRGPRIPRPAFPENWSRLRGPRIPRPADRRPPR